MKIVIVYGNNHKGLTYKAVNLLKEKLNQRNNIEYVEYHLPKDMPHFCNGCFVCLKHSRGLCPHNDKMKPIINNILSADGVILASPDYVMDVSGSMKAFLDHLFTMWMSHRPEPEMFDKIGLTVGVGSGWGISSTNKTMLRSFKYLGFKRYYSLGFRMADLEGDPAKLRKRLSNAAAKFSKALVNRKQLHAKLFRVLFFKMMRGMVNSYSRENELVKQDFKYWTEKGWLDNTRPW